jgi:hypothetical protein
MQKDAGGIAVYELSITSAMSQIIAAARIISA